jgi:intracellular sulfur oxidation DsrE/DsrF family protein
MKKILCALLVLLSIWQIGFGQDNIAKQESLSRQQKVKDSIALFKKDSAATALKDSVRWAGLDSIAFSPLIQGGKYSKVFPVKGIDEIPDPKRVYKLLFELTTHKKDTSNKELNEGLVEIARVINLHIAAGIPLTQIDPVVVAHGGALYDLLTDTAFKLKNKKINPNTQLIAELMKNKVRFIACGQALLFLDIKKEELHPEIKVALTARVAISDYLNRGYAKYEISNEER